MHRVYWKPEMGGLQKWISSISVCDAKPKRQSTFVDNVCSPKTKHRSFTVKQEKWTVEIEKLLMTQFSFWALHVALADPYKLIREQQISTVSPGSSCLLL